MREGRCGNPCKFPHVSTVMWPSPAYLSGSVDEERLLRNQQPAPHGQGEGVASATGLAWMRLGSVTNYAQGGMKGQVAPVCGELRQLGSRTVRSHLGRSLPSAPTPCFFFITCMSSIPTRIRCAAWKDLNPSIGRVTRLTDAMVLFHDMIEIFGLADGDPWYRARRCSSRWWLYWPHCRRWSSSSGSRHGGGWPCSGSAWPHDSIPVAFDLDMRLVDVIVTTHKILALVFHTQVYKLKREMSKKNLPASVSPFTFMQNEGMEVYDENPAHSLPTHGSRPTPGGVAPQSTQDYSGTSGGPRCK